MPPNVIMLFVPCRSFWVLLILGMTLSAVKNLKRTRHHLNCEFTVFQDQYNTNLIVIQRHFTVSTAFTDLIDLFQAHGVGAHQQLALPSAGRAATATEPGTVSEAAFRAPAAPTEGGYTHRSLFPRACVFRIDFVPKADSFLFFLT